jgi:hypothetical protein
MRRSRYVPLVAAIAASAVLAACDQARVADPVHETDYEGVELRGLLSACTVAPSAKATAIIDALGGSVSVAGVTLTLPAGAVDEATEFRVHVPSSTHAEVEIRANGQEHHQFLSPVVIAMDYSRCSTPSGELAVWHIDPQTKALLENMGGVNDVLNQRVIFSTMHLSGYAIAN